jgi:hypothetical protein
LFKAVHVQGEGSPGGWFRKGTTEDMGRHDCTYVYVLVVEYIVGERGKGKNETRGCPKSSLFRRSSMVLGFSSPPTTKAIDIYAGEILHYLIPGCIALVQSFKHISSKYSKPCTRSFCAAIYNLILQAHHRIHHQGISYISE